MGIFAGSIEVQYLCWAMVLGLAQLILATAAATHQQGLAYNLSPRDGTAPPVSPVVARLGRAWHNFRETFVYFAVAVLVVTVLNKSSATSVLGAQLYFWARLVYVPVYASGITVVRTLIWTVSMVGIVMVLTAALA